MWLKSHREGVQFESPRKGACDLSGVNHSERGCDLNHPGRVCDWSHQERRCDWSHLERVCGLGDAIHYERGRDLSQPEGCGLSHPGRGVV